MSQTESLKFHSNLWTTNKTRNEIQYRCFSLATVYKFLLGYGSPSYQEAGLMADRLVFPVRNQYGEFIANTGRALFDYNTTKQGKWHHSKGSWKQYTLYGLYENYETILTLGYVVIVEGPMDVLALYECGIPAIAILGVTFNREQALLLRRYTKNVITWLDNDRAGGVGLQAIEKHTKDLGMNLRIIKDKLKDPSDVLRLKGKQAVLNVIHTSTN